MRIVRSRDIEFVAASHENPDNPGVLKKVLATHSDLLTGQIQMVNWSFLPIGSSFQAHYHEDMQEVFVMISGRVRMTISSESFDLESGDSAIVDAREIHSMTNICEQDVHYVVFGISSQQGGQTIIVDQDLKP